MAFIEYQYSSPVLGINCTMNVIIPDVAGPNPPRLDEIKVLYLLHGLSDDHSAWCRYTSVERYAREKGIAVVMPAVNRSFYTDMKNGTKYWEYVSEEVPATVRRTFGFSDKRELNMIAGLSMGGYGAFKHALRYPERYFAAGSFSGVMDVYGFFDNAAEQSPDYRKEVKNIFGSREETVGSDNDTMALLEKRAPEKEKLPRLYQYIGRQDTLYEANKAFKKKADGLGIEIKYVERDGTHGWKYWDEQIKEFLDWALQ